MKSVRFRISRSTWARCRCKPRKVGAESCTRASLYGTRPTIQRASHRYGTHPAVQYAPCRYGMHPTATARALPCGIALRYTPIPTLRPYGSADKYSRSRHFDRVIAGKLSRRCAVFPQKTDGGIFPFECLRRNCLMRLNLPCGVFCAMRRPCVSFPAVCRGSPRRSAPA